MRRIGLTQRVAVVEAYDERRDCLDQQWAPLVRSLSCDPVPLANRIDDVDGYVGRLDLDGVVLTGGNDLAHLDGATNVAPERDRFERELLCVAIERELPVLAVCRGLQLLNDDCGGTLERIDDHVACTHEIDVDVRRTDVTDVPESVTVNSYHGYAIPADGLGEDLTAVARAPDGTVEWVEHDRYPITGIMWHPERESPSAALDRRILETRLPSGSV